MNYLLCKTFNSLNSSSAHWIESKTNQYGVPMKEVLLCFICVFFADTPKSAGTKKKLHMIFKQNEQISTNMDKNGIEKHEAQLSQWNVLARRSQENERETVTMQCCTQNRIWQGRFEDVFMTSTSLSKWYSCLKKALSKIISVALKQLPKLLIRRHLTINYTLETIALCKTFSHDSDCVIPFTTVYQVAPTVWNDLPINIRNSVTLKHFRSTLCTHYNRLAFDNKCTSRSRNSLLSWFVVHLAT